MNQTIRPNVRVCDLQASQSGMASPAAVDALAAALTLAVVLVVFAVVLLLDYLSEFWAGFVAGGLTGATVIIALLAVGICVGGGRLADPPRSGSCDRRVHR